MPTSTFVPSTAAELHERIQQAHRELAGVLASVPDDLLVHLHIAGVAPWALAVARATATSCPPVGCDQPDVVLEGPAAPMALLVYRRIPWSDARRRGLRGDRRPAAGPVDHVHRAVRGAVMRTIEVRRRVDAPASRMYELLADPITYRQFPDVSRAELVRPGVTDPTGVGAVRRIHIGRFRFDEEIVAAQPGVRLDYRVVASKPPLDHELGSIRFESEGGGCEVVWTSTFRVPIPLVGPLLARMGGRRMARAFDDAIRVAGEIAAGRATR